MSRIARPPIAELRRAIDRLPTATREAMLEGVRSRPIVAGDYTDRHGGVCPMLAAHRHGGRTSNLGFSRAWDRFTGARRRVRRATPREVDTLVAHLLASLEAERSQPDLGAAAEEHRALRWRHARARALEALENAPGAIRVGRGRRAGARPGGR